MAKRIGVKLILQEKEISSLKSSTNAHIGSILEAGAFHISLKISGQAQAQKHVFP